MYTLEKSGHYSIKTPLINRYKPMGRVYFPGYWRISAYLSSANQSADAFSLIEERFAAPIKKEWLMRNGQALRDMQELIKDLKSQKNMSYTDAFIFANGVVGMLLPHMPNYSHNIFTILLFVLDFPEALQEELSALYGKEGQEVYMTYLPKTFEAWPDVLADKSVEDTEKAQFTNTACILFDFILQWATFTCENVFEKEITDHLRKQVLCYYKWLTGKKIYLPKTLQERVYAFSQMK